MPRGKSKTASLSLGAREREMLAFELRKGGMSYSQIADALPPRTLKNGAQKKVTTQCACQLVNRVLKRIVDATDEDAVTVRKMELERLNDLLLGVWDQARTGHLGSVDRVIRIMERRAKLVGLDQMEGVNLNVSWSDLVRKAEDVRVKYGDADSKTEG